MCVNEAQYDITGAHNWLGKEGVGAGSAHANNWIRNIFPR